MKKRVFYIYFFEIQIWIFFDFLKFPKILNILKIRKFVTCFPITFLKFPNFQKKILRKFQISDFEKNTMKKRFFNFFCWIINPDFLEEREEKNRTIRSNLSRIKT